MKKIFSPIFILAFVAAPQTISLAHLIIAMGTIKLLPHEIVIRLIFCLFFAIYACLKRKEEAGSTKVHIAIAVVYGLFAANSMLSGADTSYLKSIISPTLLFVAACMISVLYGLLGIAHSTATPDKTPTMGKSVAVIIGVPLVWFLGINITNGANSNTIALIIIAACVYAMVFLISKWLLNRNPHNPTSRKHYILTFIIAFCMPLCGLALNQSFGSMGDDRNSTGLLGDFSSPIYYIIAALNGLLLLIPPVEDKKLRLLLFYLKSVGYAYILYFFVVFLPNLPLGFIGIIFYGLGLLVFTPAMVTFLQGYHLTNEWIVLSKSWGNWRLGVAFCIGIITLPLCITATFWGDRENFAVAAQYLDQNNFSNTRPVNLTRLQRTLKNIKGGLQQTRGGGSSWGIGSSGGSTPIISDLYTSLVLDGKVISQDNVLALENLFFDAGHNLATPNLSNPNTVNNRVRILETVGETRFDEKNQVYKSWVHLKLENYTPAGNGEYKTSFKLPPGAYISDYYLNVAGTRKEGILTDRRAALFIYRKIVNTRRDPGLVHYIGRNTLELRVFPFAPREVRDTGFEIIHKEKINLTLDNKVISLGGADEQELINVEGAVLLPSAHKAALDTVVREPKYYFVIDSSKNSNVEWHMSQVQEYAKTNNLTDADVIIASYKLKQLHLSDMPQAKYSAECGFNLNMAVRMILSHESANRFPVIIAVSDNMPGAVLPVYMYPLSDRFPESPYYYSLNHNLTLTPYSYDDNAAGSAVNVPVVKPILNYNGAYVSNDNTNQLVLTDTPTVKFTTTNNQYKDAILLDTMLQRGLSTGNNDSLELVRASFRSRILTPQTAFIVVETQQQEKELFDLQEKILNNSEKTPTVTLDEPSLTSCIILILLVLCIVKYKKISTYKKLLIR